MTKDLEGSFYKEMTSEVLDFFIILVKVQLNYGIQGYD